MKIQMLNYVFNPLDFDGVTNQIGRYGNTCAHKSEVQRG